VITIKRHDLMHAHRSHPRSPDAERCVAGRHALSDADLARPMCRRPDGGRLPGSLAFWDRRVAYLSSAGNALAARRSTMSKSATRGVNGSRQAVWLAIPPRAAASEAVAAAEAADSALDGASQS